MQWSQQSVWPTGRGRLLVGQVRAWHSDGSSQRVMGVVKIIVQSWSESHRRLSPTNISMAPIISSPHDTYALCFIGHYSDFYSTGVFSLPPPFHALELDKANFKRLFCLASGEKEKNLGTLSLWCLFTRLFPNIPCSFSIPICKGGEKAEFASPGQWQLLLCHSGEKLTQKNPTLMPCLPRAKLSSLCKTTEMISAKAGRLRANMQENDSLEQQITDVPPSRFWQWISWEQMNCVEITIRVQPPRCWHPL